MVEEKVELNLWTNKFDVSLMRSRDYLEASSLIIFIFIWLKVNSNFTFSQLGSGGGLGAVTFGVLFDATADSFPALSATLNVAKKRGVVCIFSNPHSNLIFTGKIFILRNFSRYPLKGIC